MGAGSVTHAEIPTDTPAFRICSVSHILSISSFNEKVSSAESTARMLSRLCAIEAVERNSEERAPGGSVPVPTCRRNGWRSKVSVTAAQTYVRDATTSFERMYRPASGTPCTLAIGANSQFDRPFSPTCLEYQSAVTELLL